MARLKIGDLVIRNHRLLKTQGTIVRLAKLRRGEAQQVWIKWHHLHTLPNPSLEEADNIELVVQPEELTQAGDASRSGSQRRIVTSDLRCPWQVTYRRGATQPDCGGASSITLVTSSMSRAIAFRRLPQQWPNAQSDSWQMNVIVTASSHFAYGARHISGQFQRPSYRGLAPPARPASVLLPTNTEL